MTEPWNLTEAQRRQFREAHAQAKERAMAAEASSPRPQGVSSYVASFDRIGRKHGIAPLTVTGTEREIESQILAYARPYLGSRDARVLADVQGGCGVILAGVRDAGRFTLAAVPVIAPKTEG